MLNSMNYYMPEITLHYVSEVLTAKNAEIEELKNTQIRSSVDIHEYLKRIYNPNTVELFEQFVVVFLNRANKPIGYIRHSSGGVAGTVVDIRLIFGPALKAAASSIVLAHNHPSGNLKPSEADIKITEKAKAAGKCLDIAVFDHIIITKDNYFSFDDKGLM